MIIQITEFVRINREDSFNWTIQAMHVGTKGKSRGREVWSNSGYYGSLSAAVHALIDNKVDLIMDEPPEVFEDLRSLHAYMQTTHARLEHAVRSSKRKLAKKAKQKVEESDG